MVLLWVHFNKGWGGSTSGGDWHRSNLKSRMPKQLDLPPHTVWVSGLGFQVYRFRVLGFRIQSVHNGDNRILLRVHYMMDAKGLSTKQKELATRQKLPDGPRALCPATFQFQSNTSYLELNSLSGVI